MFKSANLKKIQNPENVLHAWLSWISAVFYFDRRLGQLQSRRKYSPSTSESEPVKKGRNPDLSYTVMSVSGSSLNMFCRDPQLCVYWIQHGCIAGFLVKFITKRIYTIQYIYRINFYFYWEILMQDSYTVYIYVYYFPSCKFSNLFRNFSLPAAELYTTVHIFWQGRVRNTLFLYRSTGIATAICMAFHILVPIGKRAKHIEETSLDRSGYFFSLCLQGCKDEIGYMR